MLGETGIGIQNPLWFIGVVENRNDPRKEGRVQVRAFGIHGTNAQIPTERLPWAICIAGNYDPNYPIPPLNAWVFGFFIDGRDAQQPMILGLIPTQMTELIDPETNGWGAIPTEYANLNSQGSRATDFGQPMNSRKSRGEELEKTDILLQEVGRVSVDMSAIEEGLVLVEPAPGAQPTYPFNRVTETAGGHCLELDDSPNAARLRLGHSEGQFLEMHQNGVTVLKSIKDLWLIAEGNIVIVSKGGGQVIKVEGDALFSVDGNLVQDVTGDMRQVVHGNYELSVAGQLNLNGGEEIQARAGKIRIESNVEGINLKSAKKINIQSGEVINIKSGQGIFQEAVEDINIKGDNLFIQGTGTSNIKSSEISIDSAGNLSLKADHVIAGGGQLVSINASTVAIDDIVQLANGMAGTPIAADDAIAASPAESSELPPPAEKASGNGNGGEAFASGGYRSPSVSGSGGYISQDDGGTDGGTFTSEGIDSSYTQSALTPLLDLIGRAEGAGYDTIVGFVRKADYPAKPITQLTIGELLAWQESIDGKYNSEAVGRYQIMEDTLRGFDNNRSSSTGGISLYERAGLTVNSLFSAANQDLMAIELLKYRGLNRFLSGSLTDIQFGDKLADEWASLPVMIGPRAGQGRYSGQGGKIKIQEVTDALAKVKNYRATATQTTGPQ
jgi:muramidase (phage lysozyme)